MGGLSALFVFVVCLSLIISSLEFLSIYLHRSSIAFNWDKNYLMISINWIASQTLMRGVSVIFYSTWVLSLHGLTLHEVFVIYPIKFLFMVCTFIFIIIGNVLLNLQNRSKNDDIKEKKEAVLLPCWISSSTLWFGQNSWNNYVVSRIQKEASSLFLGNTQEM